MSMVSALGEGTAGTSLHPYAGYEFPDRWTTYTTADGLARNEVKYLLQDDKGNLWVGTNGSGVSCFDGREWTTYTAAEGLANDDVEVILQDLAGSLWFGTKGERAASMVRTGRLSQRPMGW